MSVRSVAFFFLISSSMLVVPARAADQLKEGWTSESVKAAADECTEALVQGTWEDRQQKEGGDPTKPPTAAFRKQLAPEIAKMKKLCACAVREGAKRYTRAEAEGTPADLEHAVSESIANGTCKLE